MPDLLLELLTEEIPARMQRGAADELRRAVETALGNAGLVFGIAESFVTPRRLALSVTGLPLAQKDMSEERRGPRVGAPTPAIEGFLRSAGVATIAECEERDTGRGSFYFAVIRRPGQATRALLPGLLTDAIKSSSWPKSMRFPAAGFRWVRPLRSVIALFDGEVLPLALDDVPVGDATQGHRFLAPEAIHVRDADDYRDALRRHFVVLDAAERERLITAELAGAAGSLGMEVKPDSGLLAEVTGLVEWPVVLTGRIDPHFMELPPEVLTTSMRTHQKYFSCVDRAGKLAPHFLVVANMAASDGGHAIVAGNERVLRARLSDARFFWDQDRKVPLAARVPKLAERVFYDPLGTMLDKTARLIRLVDAVAAYVPDADLAEARRAAELAKADLSTGMVGEFPELRGIMGRYYARHDGEAAAVANAIADHYAPQGPHDRCPVTPVSVTVALADRIDTLVGFFAIGETPTGSKDPFALRRAALGVIRLVLENRLRLPLARLFARAFAILGREGRDSAPDLLAFFADRLKVHLRERGVRHDLIAAIFALGGEDDLVRLLARVDALATFLASEDGANLLTAYRRAANIVRIEERKDAVRYEGAPDPALYAQDEEGRLARELEASGGRAAAALGGEDFSGAMAALASLRASVDQFFDRVTVNCDNAALRANRLRLLARIRDTLNVVADFSLIEG